MKKFVIVLSLVGIVGIGYAQDTNIEWRLPIAPAWECILIFAVIYRFI